MKNFLACALMAAGGCVANGQPVQWRVEDGGNGHWYEGVVQSSGMSWTTARNIALGKGADLVSLNTTAERSWLFANVSSNPILWTPMLGPWVGGYQLNGSPEPAGGWIWVDGTNLYAGFNWGAGSPDGNNSCGGQAEKMTYWGNYGRGASDLFHDTGDVVRTTCWNIDFGLHISAVIEYSADCNGDGIVDKGQILSGQFADANNNGVPDGPGITSQPTNQSVGVDQPVYFTVEVSSTPNCTTPINYRWQRRNPVVLDDNAPNAWIDLQDGGGFLNTATASMTILRPTAGLATGYRCKISGGCGCEGLANGVAYTDMVNFAPACPSDFNNDGAVDSDDVIMFFERWDGGC